MSDTIRIHHFALSGHAHRAVLFASLAGIEHELVDVDLAGGEHKRAPFLALNPQGQVPVLEIGDTVISDSNAILVYLARRHAPEWLPQEPEKEAEVQKFLTLAAGEQAFGPCAARLDTLFNVPVAREYVHEVAHRYLQRLEAHLENRDYLVGRNPTIADVALYSYTAHAPEGNVSLDDYPDVRRWLANIEALPGFRPMPSSAVGLNA